MIVCFRCTVETKENLDRLLATGAYGDIGEAIAAAVRNQVLMEQEVAERGAIIIRGELKTTPPPPQAVQANGQTKEENCNTREKSPLKPVSNRNPGKKASPPTTTVAVAADEPSEPHVPRLFRLDGFPQEEPKGLADLPPDLWSHGQRVPLDRWVLGQFNRLMPAKANARALVHLFLESPRGLEIAPAAAGIAGQAAVLGDYLRQIDGKHGVSRDDALATAFPSAEEGAEKGRNRYANQFVVYQNGKGELSGLMVDLKLINVVRLRRGRRIVPTRVAWEFAALTNPLLDGAPEGPPEKFSPQERVFLISHILRSVPVEAFAYRQILQAVREGQTSPEQIDSTLKVHLDEDRAEDLSQSFLASQRSGAISRMSDLGLIERRREGVRVNYAVTDEGMAFLNHCTQDQLR
jgi:hypothetical protein